MNKRKLALDSCSILHLLDPTSLWHSRVLPIYEEARKGQIQLFVSEVSIAECAKIKFASGAVVPMNLAVQHLNQFFSHSFIERRGITRRESEFAAQLIREKDFGPCDALIAATAAYFDVEVLYTSDGCTGKRKAGKLLTAGSIETPCGKTMLIEMPPAI